MRPQPIFVRGNPRASPIRFSRFVWALATREFFTFQALKGLKVLKGFRD